MAGEGVSRAYERACASRELARAGRLGAQVVFALRIGLLVGWATPRPLVLRLRRRPPRLAVGFRNSVGRGFSSSALSAASLIFSAIRGVNQPRPTQRGPADESSAFDVDRVDLVSARA